MDYRLTNRQFSRLWRRSKRYSDTEIKWLARRRGLEVKYRGEELQVVNPETGTLIANFRPLRRNDEKEDKEDTKKYRRRSSVVIWSR